MAYQCICGNKDRFTEVFDMAADVVDGKGEFVTTKARNVAYYICQKCEREIPDTEFCNLASTKN